MHVAQSSGISTLIITAVDRITLATFWFDTLFASRSMLLADLRMVAFQLFRRSFPGSVFSFLRCASAVSRCVAAVSSASLALEKACGATAGTTAPVTTPAMAPRAFPTPGSAVPTVARGFRFLRRTSNLAVRLLEAVAVAVVRVGRTEGGRRLRHRFSRLYARWVPRGKAARTGGGIARARGRGSTEVFSRRYSVQVDS